MPHRNPLSPQLDRDIRHIATCILTRELYGENYSKHTSMHNILEKIGKDVHIRITPLQHAHEYAQHTDASIHLRTKHIFCFTTVAGVLFVRQRGIHCCMDELPELPQC